VRAEVSALKTNLVILEAIACSVKWL